MSDPAGELLERQTGGADEVLTVSQFISQAKQLLEAELSCLRVEGEVSSFKEASSGHVYFTLSDGDAKLECVIYVRTARRLDTKFEVGDRVQVDGAASIFARFGKFQFQVSGLRPAGQGRLHEQFLRLKRKLMAEGLFDNERKTMPAKWPSRIGVVASAEGAALQDVLRTLGKRMPSIPVVIYPTLTQGEAAPAQIVEALQIAGAGGACDVLILCRGGGSPEDLAAYNDERLARAISSCPVPVVTGIGHQTDTTIADFVADVHAHTPTAAAECCSPDRREKGDALGKEGRKLAEAARKYCDFSNQGLDHFEKRLGIKDPRKVLNWQVERLNGFSARLRRRLPAVFDGMRQRLAHCRKWMSAGALQLRAFQERLGRLDDRLLRSAAAAVGGSSERLDGREKRLRALDYRRTLERGYSLVWSEAGELVRSAKGVRPGERLRIRFHEGETAARAEDSGSDG